MARDEEPPRARSGTPAPRTQQGGWCRAGHTAEQPQLALAEAPGYLLDGGGVVMFEQASAMNYLSVRVDGIEVGTSRMMTLDAGMGVLCGPFVPTEEYHRVEAVFRMFIVGDAAAYYEARSRLALEAWIVPMEYRLPCHFIHVVDYRPELTPDDIELEVGLDDVLPHDVMRAILRG